MKTPDTVLEEHLQELEKAKEMIICIGKDQIEAYDSMYVFDLYCTAILNRSINILVGYTSLIRSNNFLSAAPLVRIHVDTLLRIFAPHLWGKNIDDFARHVIDGKPINKLKDLNKNLLTDGHLARELSKLEDFEWVLHVYKTGSQFVHFSEKHLFTSMKIKDQKTRTMSFVVGAHDEFIPIDEKIGATIYMSRITQGILYFVRSWVELKRSYNKLEV